MSGCLNTTTHLLIASFTRQTRHTHTHRYINIFIHTTPQQRILLIFCSKMIREISEYIGVNRII